LIDVENTMGRGVSLDYEIKITSLIKEKVLREWYEDCELLLLSVHGARWREEEGNILLDQSERISLDGSKGRSIKDHPLPSHKLGYMQKPGARLPIDRYGVEVKGEGSCFLLASLH
jgi:hypothetical protein